MTSLLQDRAQCTSEQAAHYLANAPVESTKRRRVRMFDNDGKE
jgi:hypothetical protein